MRVCSTTSRANQQASHTWSDDCGRAANVTLKFSPRSIDLTVNIRQLDVRFENTHHLCTNCMYINIKDSSFHFERCAYRNIISIIPVFSTKTGKKNSQQKRVASSKLSTIHPSETSIPWNSSSETRSVEWRNSLRKWVKLREIDLSSVESYTILCAINPFHYVSLTKRRGADWYVVKGKVGFPKNCMILGRRGLLLKLFELQDFVANTTSKPFFFASPKHYYF